MIPNRFFIFSAVIFFSVFSAPVSASEPPTITSFSTDFISVTATTPYQTTLALYGSNLDYILFNPVTVTLGPLVASAISGNATGVNVTFTIDSAVLTAEQASYPIVITENNVLYTTVAEITVFNPYQTSYTLTYPKKFLHNTKRSHTATKRTVGLNVHWALGGSTSEDASYEKKLVDSHTVWAREHFSYKLLTGSEQAGWWKRYDQMMLRYRAQNIRVVGMLAYGESANEFGAPATMAWKNFVRQTVKRYRNEVDVWEIWNEPDSADYLQPNTWKTYQPLLKAGASMIREYDPDAIVLNGAIADITDHQYIRRLYRQGHQYFDDLNVHVYYCDEFREDDASLARLQNDWQALREVVEQYRPQERIWITELGCSTGLAHITNDTVKRYTNQAVRWLLQQDTVGPVLLYTFRDRTYLEAYEAYFGFLEEDFQVKPAWRWYKLLRKYS